MARIAVIGGGYAGLACLIELAKKAPQLELHLVDAGAEDSKVTNLQKTFSKPTSDFKLPYVELAERYNFQFYRQRVDFDATELQRWQQEKSIGLKDGTLAFDWLLISTGATTALKPTGENIYGLLTADYITGTF